VEEERYAIGLDFGTESARAVIVSVRDGKEVGSAVVEYPNGVIDDRLPSTGEELPPGWALQNPQDYLVALRRMIPEALRNAGISGSAVIGIGIDFTSCTMMPVDERGEPLCLKPEFSKRRNAWVKLWKHHGAQRFADRITQIATERGEDFLKRYGGKVSSEWFFPKLLETLEEDPGVYDAAYTFIEGGDWIVWKLTGVLRRNACTAGYKAFWSKERGYPSPDFLEALHPRLRNFVREKMIGDVLPAGSKAGELTPEMAEAIGLTAGTPVAVAGIDAHVATPGATVAAPGKLALVMGTSFCHLLVHDELRLIPGICGIVEGGIIPGYYGYEAGQTGGGDIYAWFVKWAVPEAYQREAAELGVNIHALLEKKASELRPGESGLLALDWWNGNRSVLQNAELSGLLLGCTLTTRPEEIYRALIEATAFGTRKIIETFEQNGIEINEVCACGGLPEKNKLVMQIFADVVGKKFGIAESKETTALGAAMFGTVAAGRERGGYASIMDAVQNMARLKPEKYVPNREVKPIYDRLYREYEKLHDYFGRGENDVMLRLRRIREEAVG